MRHVVAPVGALTLLAASIALQQRSLSATDSAPSFTKDVAPILFEKCVSCHRPGEVAPMSLLSYNQVRPWAKAIKAKVTSREMPPWHADPRFGHFGNDRSLTQQQIDTIVAWVNGGAIKGNDSDLPSAPVFTSGWQGGEPDYVFEMPFEYHVPAEGEVPYQDFFVPIPFKEDRFIEKVELRPGNPAVVHHGRVDIVKLPEGCKVVDGILIGPDGEPAFGTGSRRLNIEASTFNLIFYVPGRSLERHRPGTGKRLSAGQWVRFNLHYQPNGEAATDRTRLGIWFSKAPVTHEMYTRTVGQSLPTDVNETINIVGDKIIHEVVSSDAQGPSREQRPNIPPYAENYEITGITPVTEPITLYALTPHMHLRGKDMTWIVTWPDGREENLLVVPKYDFNWQIRYELETPLKIPAGSKLTSIGHYNNSINNKYNPAPDQEVYWGEQSWDEMFAPYVEYTVDSLNLASTQR